jgi:cytochrome P450
MAFSSVSQARLPLLEMFVAIKAHLEQRSDTCIASFGTHTKVMLVEILLYTTSTNLAIIGVVLVALVVLYTRIEYELRFKRAGGVHAGQLATNSITALPWLWSIGRAQAQNNMLAFFRLALSKQRASAPEVVEINVTGGQRFLFTDDPEHIKAILTGKFADFGKGEQFHTVWQPFLGDSIFTTDGHQWQDSRNLIRPMFVKNRVSDLHIFERWTQTMLAQLPKSGQTFDIQDLFYRLTIDIITDFLLGGSVNSLQNPRVGFVQAFTDVQRMQTMLTVLMPIEKLIPRGKYNKGIRTMEEFITPFIDRALGLSDEELTNINKSEKSFTFLHALAHFTRDPKVIRDQIIAVLLAGRDTTAATLSWMFHELTQAPNVYAKMREEVLRVVGDDRAPTYDNLKDLKYMNNCLNETLRLYPAVPVSFERLHRKSCYLRFLVQRQICVSRHELAKCQSGVPGHYRSQRRCHFLFDIRHAATT